MLLTTFTEERFTPDIHYTDGYLQKLPCGLHRVSLDEAYYLMPELKNLFDSAPVVNTEDWEVDVKIHMLMKGQFPCIPNWHCDNVPRDGNELRMDLIETESPPMYLWVSGKPLTEFLNTETDIPVVVDSHNILAEYIKFNNLPTKSIPEKTWVKMYQTTPHRGAAAEENCWRVFVRLTHKNILSSRPIISRIRRHAQVYLDANTFSW